MEGKNHWAEWVPIFAVDVRDVITCFKFGDDRFRGLASDEGQILPLPINFDGRPYNTLTLPCEFLDLNMRQKCPHSLAHSVQEQFTDLPVGSSFFWEKASETNSMASSHFFVSSSIFRWSISDSFFASSITRSRSAICVSRSVNSFFSCSLCASSSCLSLVSSDVVSVCSVVVERLWPSTEIRHFSFRRGKEQVKYASFKQR